MAKTDWQHPLSFPVQLRGHADEANMRNECATLDTSRTWVIVAGIDHEAQNNDDYNCLGWVAFKGRLNRRAEPDLDEPGHLREVTATLTAAGWARCARDVATCVVVGPHEGNVAHVFARWAPANGTDAGWLAANRVEWWESKMGQGGPHILHARNAMAGDANYGNELAWFNSGA